MASISSEKARTTTTTVPSKTVIENPTGLRPLSGNRSQLPNTIPPSTQCSYAACYCEENVFKICQSLKDNFENELDKCYAVFVSNKKRVVPLWRQKAGRDEEKLVIWDYHVIFIYRPDDRTLVYDLDSELPFPTFFTRYVTETFRTDAILNPEYHRIFRVVPATTFLQNFASDRRHMRKDDGSWLKPPPAYPCISNPSSAHNLDEFISMDGSAGFGEVLSLTDFVKKFHLHWDIREHLPFNHSKIVGKISLSSLKLKTLMYIVIQRHIINPKMFCLCYFELKPAFYFIFRQSNIP